MVKQEIGERFAVLDSLRGICACIVALVHLKSTGIVTNSTLVQNGWLFVDFFFVLSGFVIFASYGDRLRHGYSIPLFMFLRLGRIYPLHVAVLLLFVCFELIFAAAGGAITSGRVPFGEPRTIADLAISLALLQIFGLRDFLIWNGPSWSIAAEMWTYVLAAFLLRASGRWLTPILLSVVITSCVLLLLTGNGGLDRTYSFSLIRCIFGFSQGALAWLAYRRWVKEIALSFKMASAFEITAIIVCVCIIISAHRSMLALVAPSAFALTVLIFSRERGLMSKSLMIKPFVIIGKLSYSIYMVHVFVEARVIDVLAIVGKKIGEPLTVTVPAQNSTLKMLAGPGLIPDLSTCITLLVVIASAWVSYRIVEQPFRNLSRYYAAKWPVRGARVTTDQL